MYFEDILWGPVAAFPFSLPNAATSSSSENGSQEKSLGGGRPNWFKSKINGSWLSWKTSAKCSAIEKASIDTVSTGFRNLRIRSQQAKRPLALFVMNDAILFSAAFLEFERVKE
jgi:hypothetical protein